MITTIGYGAVDPVCFGECIPGGPGGNRIGAKLCAIILDEHSIDFTGSYHSGSDLHSERFNVYYKEAIGDRYTPRASWTYGEPGTMNSVRAGLAGKIVRPDNSVLGQTGASNALTKDQYTEGIELIDGVLDVARKESEGCDGPPSLQLCHSLGGGPSAGTETSDTVVEPYSAVLSSHHLVVNANECTPLDGETWYDFDLRTLKTYRRSHGQLNCNLCEIAILVQCDDPSSAMRAFAVLPTLTIGFDLSITARPSLTVDVADVKIKPVPKVITLVTGMPKPLEEEDKEIYEQLACWCETRDKEKTNSIPAPVARSIPARDPETIALACRARLAGVTRSWGVAFNELVENSKADPDDKIFVRKEYKDMNRETHGQVTKYINRLLEQINDLSRIAVALQTSCPDGVTVSFVSRVTVIAGLTVVRPSSCLGHACDAPGEGHACEAPREPVGHVCDAAGEGHACDAPGEPVILRDSACLGHACDAPGESVISRDSTCLGH